MKRRPKQFFAVRLDPDDLDHLRAVEARTGETLADQIRGAIRAQRNADRRPGPREFKTKGRAR